MCRLPLLLAFAPLALVTTAASAGIISFGGATVIAEPPPSIQLNQWESNTEIRGFFERETTLLANRPLDHVATGLVNDESLLVPGFVPAGTTVQSYLFHADSVAGFQAILSGYVIFDTPILGVLIETSSMNATDALLGRPGIIYGQHSGRRLELPPVSDDTFQISADRLRLDFTMKVDTANDNLRVVTAVPEPGAAALLSLCAFSAVRRRRR